MLAPCPAPMHPCTYHISAHEPPCLFHAGARGVVAGLTVLGAAGADQALPRALGKGGQQLQAQDGRCGGSS